MSIIFFVITTISAFKRRSSHEKSIIIKWRTLQFYVHFCLDLLASFPFSSSPSSKNYYPRTMKLPSIEQSSNASVLIRKSGNLSIPELPVGSLACLEKPEPTQPTKEKGRMPLQQKTNKNVLRFGRLYRKPVTALLIAFGWWDWWDAVGCPWTWPGALMKQNFGSSTQQLVGLRIDESNGVVVNRGSICGVVLSITIKAVVLFTASD